MKLLEVLKEAGCHPRNYGSYLTCSAKYRGGNDPGSVGVYLNKNIAKDFVTGKTFSIEDFLKETLGIKDPSRLNSILSENGSYFCLDQSEVDPFQNVVRYFSDNEIEKLKADTSYWENRGISKKTVSVFLGGVCETGKMYNRYVFPIFDARKKIQGFSGRDISGKSQIKWKHVGMKTEWAYPFIFNHHIIRESRQLILVESIGDMLSLWESGVRNAGVTFGTDINRGLLKAIIRLDPSEIIIATNNDKNFAGQRASRKIYKKLSEFFDASQLKIRLPFKNDFGEQTIEENIEWKNKI
jgi:5S rRNA maturation endonuclease (ribonuclease M5)